MPDTGVSGQRFDDYVRHHAREHELIENARQAAKLADEYRLERLNELRQEVQEDRGQFVTRVAFDLVVGGFDERIRNLEAQVSAASASTTTWIVAVGIVFVIVQIALGVLLRIL